MGEPELIMLRQWVHSLIASSATDVSVLLVYTALHPQITCRHFSKFSVMPKYRYECHKAAIIQSAHQIYIGMLASCWVATAPLSQ